MIIKGASRAGPKQLARHLLRTDTNERVEVLENRALHGYSLHETFANWQSLTAMTRGKKGLYHANIDPAEGYAMTSEQWLRSVEVLEEQLGFQGQPRVIVLHEKKGRAHAHVVWQRTDLEREVLLSDSNNYQAHERASAQLEKEFGHERVPGVHEKADFSKERPVQEVTHAEWQQAERTGLNPAERKALMTELYHTAETGQALREALAEQGYILARGDRRAFVVVDSLGEVYSLARDIKGVKAKDIQLRFPDLDPESLPGIEDAKASQREMEEAFQKEAAKNYALEGQKQASSLDLSEPTPEPEPVQEPAPAQKFEPSEEKGMEAAKGKEKERGLAEVFAEEYFPESKPLSLRGDFTESAAPLSLSAAQDRTFKKAGERLNAIADGMRQTFADELKQLGFEQAQNLADTLGVSLQELPGCLLALTGSQFAPEALREAEHARSPDEREQRRAVAIATFAIHRAEREELLQRQDDDWRGFEQEWTTERERLLAQFAREQERAEAAERLRQQKELERQEAREREHSREDDFGHTQD